MTILHPKLRSPQFLQSLYFQASGLSVAAGSHVLTLFYKEFQLLKGLFHLERRINLDELNLPFSELSLQVTFPSETLGLWCLKCLYASNAYASIAMSIEWVVLGAFY